MVVVPYRVFCFVSDLLLYTVPFILAFIGWHPVSVFMKQHCFNLRGF